MTELDNSQFVIYFSIPVNRLGSLLNGPVSERLQEIRFLNLWDCLREVNYPETLYGDGRCENCHEVLVSWTGESFQAV